MIQECNIPTAGRYTQSYQLSTLLLLNLQIMNKGPPAGNIIRKQISLLPKYKLTITPVDEKTVTIQLMLMNQSYLSENMDNLTAGDSHKSYVIVGDSENHILLLTTFV